MRFFSSVVDVRREDHPGVTRLLETWGGRSVRLRHQSSDSDVESKRRLLDLVRVSPRATLIRTRLQPHIVAVS